MLKREYKLILVLAVLIVVVLFVATPFFKSQRDISDAKTFVIEDLKRIYPNASVDIMITKEKLNDNKEKYYEIKAKVVVGQDTPCPQRIHIYYNYPEQNFVQHTPEYITPKCSVCNGTICDIIFTEEAIIASHTLNGTEDVQNFLAAYKDATATVSDNTASWSVIWDSANADYKISIEFSKDGKILSKTKVFRE